jgi:hypothetical protein
MLLTQREFLAAPAARAVAPVATVERVHPLPLAFETNRRQTDRLPAVSYLAHGPGYTLFLTGPDAVMTFARRLSALSATARSMTRSLRRLLRRSAQPEGVHVLRPALELASNRSSGYLPVPTGTASDTCSCFRDRSAGCADATPRNNDTAAMMMESRRPGLTVMTSTAPRMATVIV